MAREKVMTWSHMIDVSVQSSSRAALLRSYLTVVSCFVCSLTFSRRPLSSSSPSCPPSCPLLAIWTSMFSTIAAFSGLAMRIVFTETKIGFDYYLTILKLKVCIVTAGPGGLIENLRKDAVLHVSFLLPPFLLFLSILFEWAKQYMYFKHKMMYKTIVLTWPDCPCCCCWISASLRARIACNSSSAI